MRGDYGADEIAWRGWGELEWESVSLVNGEFAVVESGGKNIRQLKLTDANAAGDSNCLIY